MSNHWKKNTELGELVGSYDPVKFVSEFNGLPRNMVERDLKILRIELGEDCGGVGGVKERVANSSDNLDYYTDE